MSTPLPDPLLPGIAPPWTLEGQADPHRWFATMLRERPLALDPEVGVWHVFRFEDVHEFLRRPLDWSVAKRLERVPPQERVVRLLTSDPPLHVQLRAYFSHAYRPRRVRAMQKRVRQVCRQLLEKAASRGKLDLVADFASPLTLSMIGQIIGVPEADQHRLATAGRRVLGKLKSADDPDSRMVVYMGGSDADAQQMVADYFRELIAERRADPRDDLVSKLAAIPADEIEGRLDVGELLLEQLGAGENTTVHLIGSMMALLLEHPDQLAKLRRNPERVPSAVEETLRYAAPLPARPRISVRPLRIRGVEIPEGAQGLAWLQAANLDPRVFPDPERFDVERSPNHHITFGYGEHFCLGAHLARMEARIALEEWLRMVKDYGRAEDGPLEWTPDFLLRGLARLPLEITPA